MLLAAEVTASPNDLKAEKILQKLILLSEG